MKAASIYKFAIFCSIFFMQSNFGYATYQIRLNSVAYDTNDSKIGILMSTAAVSSGSTWTIVGSSDGAVHYGPASPSSAITKWSNTYAYIYQLDFTNFKSSGTFKIVLQNSGSTLATSVFFNITSDMTGVYDQLVNNAIYFFRAQRDGQDVDTTIMKRKPSHLADKAATVYQIPAYNSNDEISSNGPLTKLSTTTVDVEGGWFDAGDYLKFVETASYTLNMMQRAYLDYGNAFSDLTLQQFEKEIHHGINWLLKMWNPNTNVLYYQVGIGGGNHDYISDHDMWRLPEIDDTLNVGPSDSEYYVKYRPVFQTGSSNSNSLSPNLAGRVSAAFAQCYQIFKVSNATLANLCKSYATSVYSKAQVSPAPSKLVSATPFDFYPESMWTDDMILGGVELYRATGNSQYLQDAANYAKTYLKDDGADVLNLYDVGVLASYELHKEIKKNPGVSLAVTTTTIENQMKLLLDTGLSAFNKDPFGLAIAYNSGEDLTPSSFGYWTLASIYNEITGSTTYSMAETRQRDWMFGNNAWGTSFIVGVGALYPHCIQHQVANLISSPDGAKNGYLLFGAVVDGPSVSSNFNGLDGLFDNAVNCPANGGDVFSSFTGQGASYQDNAAAWPSVEPADDYTVNSLYIFAKLASKFNGNAPVPVTSQSASPVTSQSVTSSPVTSHTPAPLSTHSVTSQAVTSQAMTSHTVTSQAMTSHTVTSQSVSSQAISSHTVTTQAVTSHVVTTQRAVNSITTQTVLNSLTTLEITSGQTPLTTQSETPSTSQTLTTQSVKPSTTVTVSSPSITTQTVINSDPNLIQSSPETKSSSKTIVIVVGSIVAVALVAAAGVVIAFFVRRRIRSQYQYPGIEASRSTDAFLPDK